MTLSESDLEQLESYLDDALDGGELESLRSRIAMDGELASALEQLRQERAARAALFAALEPAPAEVDALVVAVHGSIARRRQFARLLRTARRIAAAAACFLLGFLIHASFFTGRPPDAPGHDRGGAAGSGIGAVEMYEVTLRDDSGRIVAVQRFESVDRAREFVDDLSNWQRRSGRLATGQFVVHAERL